MANYSSGSGLTYGGMGARGAVGRGMERWFINELKADVHATMAQRVRTACVYLQSKVRQNISVPVTYSTGPRGGKIVNRSKPGEYPRRETGDLKKAISISTKVYSPVQITGYVTVDLKIAPYGKPLEESKWLNRFYLLRTYYENFGVIQKMMTGPMLKFTRLRGASVSMQAGIR